MKMQKQVERGIPSPPPGERARVRGQSGQQRARTVQTRKLARHLRKNSTETEKRLWRLLRDRRFAGFKFRRQYPSGPYYLDFYCTLASLAVELDGGGHGFPDRRARDEKRNRFVESKGIKVLRFWNHQIRQQPEAIRFEIWHALMERTGRVEEIAGFLTKPTPAPSPQPSPPMGAREKRTLESSSPLNFPKSSNYRERL